jgi:hypothetical protein
MAVGVYVNYDNTVVTEPHFTYVYYGGAASLLTKLSQIYQTKRVLMTADFNIALEEEGTNRGINNKWLTFELLHEIIAENHLVDVRHHMNKNQHTWYCRDSSVQSSCINYIFSSAYRESVFFLHLLNL